MIETRKRYSTGSLQVIYQRKQTESGDWLFIVNCVTQNTKHLLFQHTFSDPKKAINYFNSICKLIDKLLWFTPEYAINSLIPCETTK